MVHDVRGCTYPGFTCAMIFKVRWYINSRNAATLDENPGIAIRLDKNIDPAGAWRRHSKYTWFANGAKNAN